MLCKKKSSLKVRKYHRKIPVLETVFSKVAGFKACNFITKKVQHRCFPVKFAKFLRIPILKNICERLLLYLHYNSHHHFNFHHVHYHQKQPLAGVLQNRCSGKFCLCHRETPVLESLFNKVADLRPATLIKRDSNTGVFLRNF